MLRRFQLVSLKGPNSVRHRSLDSYNWLIYLKPGICFLAGTFDGRKIPSFLFEVNF
jgi:hypothetical protein